MKTPFHRFFAPVVSERRIEGAPVETPGGNGHFLQRLFFLGALLLAASRLSAGFASTETFLPAVGRIPGRGGAQFYTTVWASNLTPAPQTLTFEFLKQGQANTSPAKFTDSLAPGETKIYEDVIESKLGLANAVGAARGTSSREIFVSERIYNQAAGADVGDNAGLFFAGVPKSFSISAGHYMVNGVRKSFEGFVPVSENRDFIPRSPNDRSLTAGLPAEGLRRLKATGILNADGTINLETAHRMGWDRQESWKRAEERAKQ